MKQVMQNCVAEWSYLSEKDYKDPFKDVGLSAMVTDPDGEEQRVPGFWGGGNVWRLRYSSPKTGIHSYRTVCTDESNGELHGHAGEIRIVEYNGENPLLSHGPLRKSEDATHLEHRDGTPFFWLADTWWMGFTTRLSWPSGFQSLTDDRVRKGFSVVQIVAGLYPDMDWYDPRGANEAGMPWDKEFNRINPDYFDMADLKIAWLVQRGIVPCIVGCWGYFIDLAGKDALVRHWEHLVARYGAYPVVWCMAGEANMSYYLHEEFRAPGKREEHAAEMRKGWTEITKHVRGFDPFHRPVTIHPTRYGHEQIDDPGLLDLDMLQTGHGGYNSLTQTVEMITSAVARKPRMPVINSEVCYEGICGSSYSDVQRFLFWSCLLSGACGHTYGANGIWQLNSPDVPYGPSPHGATWGNTPWTEASQLPGSKHVGLGKKLLTKYRWWKFEPHPEWLDEHPRPENRYIANFAAGIPGEVRVIFLSNFARFGWGETAVRNIEKDVTYRAYYYDPVTGDEYDQGTVTPDGTGTWKSGKVTIFQDWILVLEKSS